MSITEAAAAAKRAIVRETLGAVVRAKAARADNLERIAEIVELRAVNRASLQPADFQAAATEWRVDPAALHALADAESVQGGFENGRAVILVECHIFSLLTAHAFDVKYPHLSYAKWIRHVRDAPPPPRMQQHPYQLDQDGRWGLFVMQAELDFDAAIGSMSVGRFQQVTGSPRPDMGWKLLQYPSAEALFRKLARSEADQLEILHRFLTVNGLLRAFATRDWPTIARVYNGPGQVAAYSARMATQYRKRARLYA